MTDIFLKPLRAKGPFTCLDAFLIEFNGFFEGFRRLFGQEDISIHAVSRYLKGFPGQSYGTLSCLSLPGFVHDLLSLIHGASLAPAYTAKAAQ